MKAGLIFKRSMVRKHTGTDLIINRENDVVELLVVGEENWVLLAGNHEQWRVMDRDSLRDRGGLSEAIDKIQEAQPKTDISYIFGFRNPEDLVVPPEVPAMPLGKAHSMCVVNCGDPLVLSGFHPLDLWAPVGQEITGPAVEPLMAGLIPSDEPVAV